MDLPDLLARADHTCELCGATDDLDAVPVPPRDAPVLACATCRAELATPTDPNHWRCLQTAMWSEVPAVQVLALRTLRGLGQGWADDLAGQLWLDDDTRDWADAEPVTVVDSNGAQLSDGDSVTLIKDLDVKGAGFTAKRGTMVKNIRLGDDPTHVEGRVNGTAIYLKTEFLKKA